MRSRLALLIFILLLATPTSALVDKFSGTVADSWVLWKQVSDTTFVSATDFQFMCKKDMGLSSAGGALCDMGQDITITEFTVTVTDNLANPTAEEGVWAIALNDVRQTDSDIIVGDGTTAVCDREFLIGGSTDIDIIGESCTRYVNIFVPAGAVWDVRAYAGATPMTAAVAINLTAKGIFGGAP